MLGFAIGNYIARSGLFEYMEAKLGDNIGVSQATVIFMYIIVELINYTDNEERFTVFKSLTLLFLFSILMAIPAGSVYSSIIYKALDDKDDRVQENEKEMVINWILIMQDAGSLLAQAATAFILIVFYRSIVENPPS